MKREKTIFKIAARVLSFIKEGTRKYSIGLHNLIPKRPKQKEKQATQGLATSGWKNSQRIFHSTPITERNRATTDRPENKNKQLQPRTDQTDRPPQKKPETKEDTQQQPTTGPRVSFQATQEQTDPVKGGKLSTI
jgi:hypothetical protein